MSAATKQTALAAFLAHARAEWSEIGADVEKGLAFITPIADAAAPIAATVLAATGNGPSAAAVVAVDKVLDAGNAVAQGGVTATGFAGLIEAAENAAKKL